MAERGGIRTHGTVTRTTVFETALEGAHQEAKVGRGGRRLASRESRDQGANNAGCRPL